MAAAVADYRPAAVANDKIKKKDGDMSIPLERTPDILGTIGPRKAHQFLCGFSMETHTSYYIIFDGQNKQVIPNFRKEP